MILLLNDTSDYHNGCKAVVQSYTFDRSIKTRDAKLTSTFNFKKYDMVILNGEGTMHDSAPTAMTFLRALKYAQNSGCETKLMNTVWQNMSPDYDDVLKKCSEITVREVLSYQEMKNRGIRARIVPDRSISIDVPYEEYPHVHVYDGQTASKFTSIESDNPRINIFEQSWGEVVNRLRHADLLVTSRHHEMYAAIKARCKFIVGEGNTWKNRGLMQSAGVSINFDDREGILEGKYDKQYERIFDYCLHTK